MLTLHQEPGHLMTELFKTSVIMMITALRNSKRETCACVMKCLLGVGFCTKLSLRDHSCLKTKG